MKQRLAALSLPFNSLLFIHSEILIPFFLKIFSRKVFFFFLHKTSYCIDIHFALLLNERGEASSFAGCSWSVGGGLSAEQRPDSQGSRAVFFFFFFDGGGGGGVAGWEHREGQCEVDVNGRCWGYGGGRGGGAGVRPGPGLAGAVGGPHRGWSVALQGRELQG